MGNPSTYVKSLCHKLSEKEILIEFYKIFGVVLITKEKKESCTGSIVRRHSYMWKFFVPIYFNSSLSLIKEFYKMNFGVNCDFTDFR